MPRPPERARIGEERILTVRIAVGYARARKAWSVGIGDTAGVRMDGRKRLVIPWVKALEVNGNG